MTVNNSKRIHQLVEKLQASESEETRFNAVVSLESMGTEAVEAAFDELIYALHKDKSCRIRSTVAVVLGIVRSRVKEASAALTKRIREDEEEEVRAMAAIALGELTAFSDETLPELFTILKSEQSVKVKITIVKVLRETKKEEVIIPLKEAMKEEENTDIKFEIAYTLVTFERSREEGIQILKTMYQNNELNEIQKLRFEILCEELNLKELLVEAEKTIKSAKKEIEGVKQKVEKKPDDPEKTNFLSLIDLLQTTNKQQEETIEGLRNALQQMTTTHQMMFEQSQQTILGLQEAQKPVKETWWERWSGEVIVGALGMITTVITAILGIIF